MYNNFAKAANKTWFLNSSSIQFQTVYKKKIKRLSWKAPPKRDGGRKTGWRKIIRVDGWMLAATDLIQSQLALSSCQVVHVDLLQDHQWIVVLLLVQHRCPICPCCTDWRLNCCCTHIKDFTTCSHEGLCTVANVRMKPIVSNTKHWVPYYTHQRLSQSLLHRSRTQQAPVAHFKG